MGLWDVEHLGTGLPLVLHMGMLLIPSSPDFDQGQNNLGEGCCPVVNCSRAELTAWLFKVFLLGNPSSTPRLCSVTGGTWWEAGGSTAFSHPTVSRPCR